MAEESNAVAITEKAGLVDPPKFSHLPVQLKTLDEYLTLGELLYKSGYFKDVASVAQAVAKMIAGAEMGFGPMASLNGVYIQGGRPSFMANLIAAAVQKNGYSYRVDVLTNEECKLTFYGRDGKYLGVSTFNMEDAKLAGLTTGNNAHSWKKFPRNMLFSRTISNGAKWYCPGIFGGFTPYTPEELDMVIDGETGEVLVKADEPPRSPDGSQSPKTEHVAPTPPTPVTTPVPEPKPAPVSELDEALGRKSITEQEKEASVVKIWDGKAWLSKPADDHIKSGSAEWFGRMFVGKDKAFENSFALFGHPSQKDVSKRGHIGKHYSRTNLFDQKSALTYREFSELVAYAWWKQGDHEHGTLSLPRYQDKLKEELDKQDAIPYDNPKTPVDTTEKIEAPSVAEIRELGKTVGVNIDDLAADVIGVNSLSIDDNDVNLVQRMALYNVVTFIKQNIATDPNCNSIKNQQDLLKIELGIS